MPVFMGASLKNTGVQLLLDGVLDYLPPPQDVENKAIQVDEKTGDEKEIPLNPDPKAPTVCLAFKLEDGKHGQLTWMKVFSGALKVGSMIGESGTMKRG
eukprot:UN08860